MKDHNERPAPVAVIDIGTNTLRLLIGSVAKGKVLRIASSRSVTRLGQNLQTAGKLSGENIDNSIASLITFKEMGDRYGVREYKAVGTSALREAANSREFLDEVKKSTGISAEVISGDREAELIIKGIIAGMESGDNLRGPSLILDIGGGSTEWIIVDGKNHSMSSIPLGAVRLHELFIRHDPPTPEEAKTTEKYVFEHVKESFLKNIPSQPPGTVMSSFKTIIATGGTATTIAAIDLGLGTYEGDKVHSHRISTSKLQVILKELAQLPLIERSKIRGLEPERADIIIPGLLIFKTIMEMMQKEEAIVSDYGLLEGLLIELFDHQ
ncbi:MAG: hypothetical protein ACOYW7_01015 [Nitrospirota bacterium]